MDFDKFKCSRDEFVKAIQAENIGCAVHYSISLSKQPALKPFCKNAECPIAEAIAKRIFSLPAHPELNREDLNKILEAVEKVSSYYLR